MSVIPSDLIARARALPIEDEIERRGIELRGRIERCGPCPVCGGRDRFAVNTRKQVFNCRGCRVGGGIIGLVQHLDGVGFRQAIETLTGERSSSSTRISYNTTRNSRQADTYQREQRRKAGWLWARRAPLSGSIAERYLREARGINCTLPTTLAYLPPIKPEHHPALIAAYGLPDEPEPNVLAEPHNVSAVHLVLLKADGGKADCRSNKLTVGSPAGVPIVLAPPNDLLGLVIAEGIEDALSLHQTTRLGAWAVGGASFMPALADAIPTYIECVTIAVDDDSSGRRYASELAARLAGHSLQVEFLEIGR